MSHSAVVRVGITARRPAHDRSAFVADLLEHLRSVGFDGAPRALGFDADGRQVFEWVEGVVPQRGPFRLRDAQLVEAAALLRRYHDAAASFRQVGDAETVTHGDLGPHNTVFRDGSPIAIIDWDEDVRPGSRLDDFAQGVWGFADLLAAKVPVERQAHGLALMCGEYGATATTTLDALGARFDRAETDHRRHDRPRAVAVFTDLIDRLDRTRARLLAGAHERASEDGA